MSIPFLDPARAAEREWPRIRERVDQVLATCRFVNGPLVGELEAAIAAHAGTRHAVALGSAGDALLLLLKAAGIGRGGEVVVPCSSVAAAAAAVHAGARPRFADLDPASGDLDPASLDGASLDGAAAVVSVRRPRRPAGVASIAATAARYGVPLAESGAPPAGAALGGRPAGIAGVGRVLGFHPGATLAAVGDAAMLACDDGDLAERCRLLRNHGQDDRAPYVWHLPGFNSRTDDLQAAVLLARLETLPAATARRAELAERYDRRLAALDPLVVLPPAAPDPEAAGAPDAYEIEAEERDRLVAQLGAAGIGTACPARPAHLQPCFAGLRHRPGDFPVAERAAARTLALPLHPELTGAEVDRVCDAVEAFYETVSLERS